MQLWKHDFRGKKLVFAIAAAACQAFLLLGFDQGVMSGIVGADNAFARDFNNPGPEMIGNISALYDIGCVLGSIVCYFIGERYGRRTMLIWGGFIMILGAITLGASHTVAQLIAGRIVTGIGNGINSSTAPVYLAESAPSTYRGALLTAQGTFTILGVVIAYWMDFGTSYSDLSFQWRFPLSFQAVFAICLMLQIVGLPETPRWLVAHDRYTEAAEVVARIQDAQPHDQSVVGVVGDIRAVLEEEQKDGPFRFRELLTMGKEQNLRRTVLTIFIQLGQQFSGSNMINYYLPTILQDNMGLARRLSLIIAGCAQITYLFGAFIPVFLMDRYGRRPLLMVCSGGLCFCFVMVSILLSLNSPGPAYASVAFIFIFQLFYGIGWLPVPWFYATEITTTRVRTRMQAIASGWNWMAVFAVVKITPISFDNIGWRTFIVFAVLNAAFIPMTYCFYPETKGIELEDIPLLFTRGGLTGGVLHAKGGRTVEPHQHAQEAHFVEKERDVEEEVETEAKEARDV